jgi:prophage antirepressor-like protein
MEIQEENSLMTKQFEELNVPIYGTYEEPLFKAKDIGDLLGIKNIRESIKNFNDKQKCDVSLTDAIGREQITTFLSEDGLYKVLMRSRKAIAEKFQDWVCGVIKEIRKTGEYKNKKFIENETKSITLIEHFTDKRIVYLGVVKELEDYTILKYGCTKMIKDTLNRHRNTYGPNFYFIYMTECEKT